MTLRDSLLLLDGFMELLRAYLSVVVIAFTTHAWTLVLVNATETQYGMEGYT